MPRISKVTWPKMRMAYGDMFDIRSAVELEDWFLQVRVPAGQKEFTDAVETLRAGSNGSHAREGALILTVAEIRGCSILDSMCEINDRLMNAMRLALSESGRIFISWKGAWFTMTDELKVTQSRKIDLWALPSAKLTISKWPNGKHYYARLGDAEVVVYGKEKWDTYAEAEAAGKKFMRSKRR